MILDESQAEEKRDTRVIDNHKPLIRPRITVGKHEFPAANLIMATFRNGARGTPWDAHLTPAGPKKQAILMDVR